MRNILSRLLSTGNFDIQIFGDKAILDEGLDDSLCLSVDLIQMTFRHRELASMRLLDHFFFRLASLSTRLLNTYVQPSNVVYPITLTRLCRSDYESQFASTIYHSKRSSLIVGLST